MEPRGEVGSKAHIDDLNFKTCSIVTWSGMFRLGELTFTDKELRKDRRAGFLLTKVRRRDVTRSPDDDHVTLRLRRSKADKLHHGINIVMARTGKADCPVAALRRLFTEDPRPSTAPLSNTYSSPLKRSWFIPRLRKVLTERNVPNASSHTGHSFRHGAAQFESDRGLKNEEIQALGRWSSEAFQRFIVRSLWNKCQISQRFLTGDSILTPPSTS